MQGLFAVADRGAQDDKAVTNEPVHELGVLVSGLLTPDLAQRISLRAVKPAAPRNGPYPEPANR